MDVFDAVAKHATRVVVFDKRGLAFQVRAVTSVELALHKVAGLIAARGPKSNPAGDRLKVDAEQARSDLLRLKVKAGALLDQVTEGLEGEALAEGTRDFWASEVGKEHLTQAAALNRLLEQHSAELAHKRGPEKTKEEAERQQAMVCAGVIGMGSVVDGNVVDMRDIAISLDKETSREDGRLNIRDVSWAVPIVASAVLTLTKGDADARLAPFREEPGQAVAAVPTGEGGEHGPGDSDGVPD